MWCIVKINNEYRKRMHRCLKLYDEEYQIICFDEKHKQLIDDLKPKIPMKMGYYEKYD
jgi:hypothetical protein